MNPDNIDLTKLIKSLKEGVVVHDVSTKILYANPSALDILRLTEEQVLGKSALDPEWRFIDSNYKLLSHQDYPVNRVLAKQKEIENLEIGICDSTSDSVTWVLCNAFPQFNSQGNIEQIVVSFLDITSQKTKISFEDIVAHANDVIVVTEASPIESDGPKIVYVNNAFCDLTGYTASEVIGKTPRILQGPDTSCEVKKRVRKALSEKTTTRERILNYTKSGVPYWLDMNIFPLMDEWGEVSYFAAVERDATLQVEKEQKLKVIANKDSLTGLYNRRGFYELAYKKIISQAKENQMALAILDIDFFKKINDSFGHECGDTALVELVGKLNEEFGEPNLLCRFGGEEFLILLTETDLEAAKVKLESFRKGVASSPLNLSSDVSTTMTVSLGLAQVKSGSRAIETAIKNADKALYEAKRTGRNKVCIAKS
ncbi:diguanylate cyclase [Vibrio marisflavi]|nr:diguanylate cyclase [Vibrio marisflavi]